MYTCRQILSHIALCSWQFSYFPLRPKWCFYKFVGFRRKWRQHSSVDWRTNPHSQVPAHNWSTFVDSQLESLPSLRPVAGFSLSLQPLNGDRDVKPLVSSLDVLSGDLKERTHFSKKVAKVIPVLLSVNWADCNILCCWGLHLN